MKRNSTRMTAGIVLEIKQLLALDCYHQHQIAAMFGINQGRISETKHGRYDHLLV